MVANDDLERILISGRRVVAMERAALELVEQGLGDSFAVAVRAIADRNGRICLTGLGKAGLIARKIQATLASTGSPAYFLHPAEAMHGDLGMVLPEDLAICFSKSGNPEIAQLMARLKQLGCLTILITANNKAPASNYADFVLNIPDCEEACPLGLAPTTSTTAMLALGDALAVALMEQQRVAPKEFARNHPGGSLGKLLTPVHEVMRTGSGCPTASADTSLEQCYDAFRKAPQRAGAIMVTDADNLLIGIATNGDIFRFLIEGGDKSAAIGAMMIKTPKTIRPEATLAEAEALMTQFRIDDLPVVGADGTLVGLLDLQDIRSR